MKNKFIWFTAGIVCLLIIGAAAPSIYTPWTAFLGTNQVLVATNPLTGKIVIGPATPISTTASNAASAIAGASNANYVRIQSGTANLLSSTNPTDYGTLTVQGASGFPGSAIFYGTNGSSYTELRANKDVLSNSSWVLPTNGMAGNTVGLMLATNTGASTGQLSVATIGGGLALSADGTTIGIGSISNSYVLNNNGNATNLSSFSQTNLPQLNSQVGSTFKGLASQSTNILEVFSNTALTLAISPWGQRIQDGSASAPSISFNTQTNMGFYRIGSGDIGVSSSSSSPQIKIEPATSGGIFFISGEVLGWGDDNSTTQVTPHTSLYRLASTAVGVGLGGASGFGSLSASNLNAMGTVYATNGIAVGATVVSGAGNGNTNYTLMANMGKAYMGSSNVSISAIMGGTAGTVFQSTVTITNLSANTWGIQFSSVTNRWWFRGLAMQTNSPVVITNNTALVLRMEIDGTNVLCDWEHYAPFP